jgi:membrane-associated phospholipid phosphatase
MRLFSLASGFIASGMAILIGLISTSSPITTLSISISHQYQALQPFWLPYFAEAISLIEFALIIILPLLLGYLILTHKPRATILLVSLSSLSWLIARLLKPLFHETCPTSLTSQILYPFRSITDYVSHYAPFINPLVAKACYPSGHVTSYTVIFTVLFLLRHQFGLNLWLQRFISFISVFLIVTVGLARLSLGAHWLTDIVGGYLFGYAYLCFLFNFVSVNDHHLPHHKDQSHN